MLPVTGADQQSRSMIREVTIRFPQTDAAGIVFYPRYFEMVRRCFPQLPLGRNPTLVTTQFLRPNRLGDVIELEYSRSEDRHWTVNGRCDGQLCFSMTPNLDPPAMAVDAHQPNLPGFRTQEEPIGEWALGAAGRLQLSRYFEMLNIAIEEWFEQTLDIPFHELHVGQKVGIPTVQFDTQVRSLPPEGAMTSIWIRPDKVGDRALTFTSWLVANEVCFVQNRQVVVFVEMQEDGYESIPIPDWIAREFTKQLDQGADR